MAAPRFTKAERNAIRFALEYTELHTGFSSKDGKAAQTALGKLELAEMPVKRSYLTVPEAISAFREVLGPRLLAPPFSAQGVLGMMKKRIQALGLTRADCVTIAKVAGVEWQGVIRAESLVRQADKLLASGQLELPATRTPQPNNTSPLELGDEDI